MCGRGSRLPQRLRSSRRLVSTLSAAIRAARSAAAGAASSLTVCGRATAQARPQARGVKRSPAGMGRLQNVACVALALLACACGAQVRRGAPQRRRQRRHHSHACHTCHAPKHPKTTLRWHHTGGAVIHKRIRPLHVLCGSDGQAIHDAAAGRRHQAVLGLSQGGWQAAAHPHKPQVRPGGCTLPVRIHVPIMHPLPPC